MEPVAQQEKPKKPTKPTKHKYAEFVLLTEAEYQKLVDAHGEEGAQWMITKLDNYKAARGMTYKSDYRAILIGTGRAVPLFRFLCSREMMKRRK